MSRPESGFLSVEKLVKAANGTLVGGDPAKQLTGVSTDSRTLGSGDLFVALRGERFDGHQFFSQALAAGAGGLLGRRGSLGRTPGGWDGRSALIEVDDPLYAMGEAARYWRERHPVPLLAITGSVGKTTTKEMVSGILSLKQSVLKTEGNLNTLIGLPLTLFGLRHHHQAAVIEMGMNTPGEIRRLCEIAKPDFGLVTQVAPVHLEGLGSIEGVAKAKGELFDALSAENTAVINLDDPWVLRVARKCPARRVTFGRADQAMIRALQSDPFDVEGAKILMRIESEERNIRLRCHGVPCVKNAVAAAACAWAMGSASQEIVDGLEAFSPYYMRFIVIPLKNDIHLIDDTYNANPVSTSAALETFSHLAGGRTVAVLGDMLELGDYASEAHLEVGKRAADLGVQVLIAVGDMAETLARAARESATPPEEIHALSSSREAGRVVLERCRPGDWILVKGSRGVEMELVVNAIVASFPPKSIDAGESHSAPSTNCVAGSAAEVRASSGPRAR